MIQPVHDHFACLSILFDGENHMDRHIRPIKNPLQLVELFLNMTTNCGRNFNVTTCVFKRHFCSLPSSQRATSLRVRPRPFAHASREYASDRDTWPPFGAIV